MWPVGLLGLAASFLTVVGGALAGAAEPSRTGLWSVPQVPVNPHNLVIGLLGYFGGLIILVRAWLLLRRHHRSVGLRPAMVIALVALWSAPFVIGPPLASRDVYAYVAQGRLAEQGFDPYHSGPNELGREDPTLAPVDPLYRGSASLYGPVFVGVSSVVAAVAGPNVIVAVFLFRLLAIVGLALAAVSVWDLARGLGRDPTDALILAVANPLILLHLVSGAHNEALMIGFMLAGIALARRHRIFSAIALCAIAAAIKLPAVLAVAFVGWWWVVQDRRWGVRFGRMALVITEALAVTAVAGVVTGVGWGWVDAMLAARPVDAYLSLTRIVGGGLAFVFGVDAGPVLTITRLAGVTAAAFATGILLLRRQNNWLAALGWALLMAAVLHPTTQPWYLAWGLLLLAVSGAGERNRSLVMACAAAVFVVLPMGPQLGLVLLDNVDLSTIIIGLLLLSVLTMRPARSPASAVRQGLNPSELTVLVPVRGEGPNIVPFVDSIENLAADPKWQAIDPARSISVVFVDDSDDETPQVIRDLVRAREQCASSTGVSVSMVHRLPDQRWGGLGGAVVDGLGVASGDRVVVMDGDLQHPATYITELIRALDDGAEVAVASRRVEGGSYGDGLTTTRRCLSVGAAAVARLLFPGRIGPITDPLSGYFALRMDRIDLSRLHPDGFKILVEVVASHDHLIVAEVPFEFTGRTQGVSKAAASEGARYLGHLVDLRLRLTRLWGGVPVTQRAVGSGPGRAPSQQQPAPEVGFWS